MKFAQMDIVLVSLDPTIGHEQSGTRPVVIISSIGFHNSGMCIVCPLTTNIKSFYGDIILRPDTKNKLAEMSEILVGQVRTIDARRITKKIGTISQNELHGIFSGLDALCGR